MALEGVGLIESLQKIGTPEGVQTLQPLILNGVTQWISIRGQNERNPVLLFIHGGPGSPTMPTSWAFQRPWEDFFTVVQWDQRCAGKNWAATESAALAPTITLAQLVDDAEAVAAQLMRALGKDRLVVMGWSFGTRIAMALVTRRPEWFSAYVGVGQLTRRPGTEAYIYEQVKRIARERNQHDAIAELAAVDPYPDPTRRNDTEKMLVVRKWVRAFNCGWYGQSDLELYYHLQNLSPECRGNDVETLRFSTRWFIERLADNDGTLPPAASNARDPVDFAVPVIMIMGRYDLQTPFVMAKAYFDQVRAPHKRFVTFTRGGHFPMFEQPGRFLKTLLDEVLPLTEGEAEIPELPDAPR